MLGLFFELAEYAESVPGVNCPKDHKVLLQNKSMITLCFFLYSQIQNFMPNFFCTLQAANYSLPH